MEIIYLNEQNDLKMEPSCVALGFFDGFHLGHLKLVNEVIKVSKRDNLKKALLTFDVQPRAYLTNQPFKYLMSLEDKINLLKSYDFDYLLVSNKQQINTYLKYSDKHELIYENKDKGFTLYRTIEK